MMPLRDLVRPFYINLWPIGTQVAGPAHTKMCLKPWQEGIWAGPQDKQVKIVAVMPKLVQLIMTCTQIPH